MDLWRRGRTDVIIIIITTIVFSHFFTVETTPRVKMNTKRQVLTRNPGERVHLDCNFTSDYYKVFNTPSVWSKEQLEETVELNTMSVLSTPFINSGRFFIKFDKEHRSFNLKLLIEDLLPSDTGNYTCSVRGGRSNTLAKVSHLLIVHVPLKSVRISGPDVSLSRDLVSTLHNSHNAGFLKGGTEEFTLVIREHEAAYVNCIVISGYPPPRIVLKVGNHSVNSFFNEKVAVSTSGPVGLRLIKYEVTMWTDSLKLTHQEDEQVLQCQARFEPGVVAQSDAVDIHVLYKPHIQCPRIHTYTGQKDLKLTCTIKSRPNLQAIRWALDEDKGLFVDNTSTYGEYNFLVRDLSEDTMEVVLMILIVDQNSFRSYTLIAENLVGVGRESTTLIRNYPLPFNSTTDDSDVHGDPSNSTGFISLAQKNNITQISTFFNHSFTILLLILRLIFCDYVVT